MNGKEITCCFTGHRNIPNSEYERIALRLDETILSLLASGITDFAAGGALGFDTLAALRVLRLKLYHPQLRLILILPCKNQTEGWSRANIGIYNEILARSDEVIYTAESYTPKCMFVRNRRLVDSSSVCVCYLTKNTGGSAYTASYAEKSGLKIVNIG